VDFLDDQGRATELGRIWADEMSQALECREHNFKVLNRSSYFRTAQRAKMQLWELRFDGVPARIGLEAGADAVLFGRISRSKEQIGLSTWLVRTEDNQSLVFSQMNVPISIAMEDLLARALPTGGASEGLSPNQEIRKPGQAGDSYPTCLRCPNPQYTSEARAKQHEGTALLRVIVTPDGRAAAIRVARFAPYGLTERAIEAVRDWKFNPAKTMAGIPVPVDLYVEITFRLPH
jgi:TonB family protein